MFQENDASFGIAAVWLLACIVAWLGVRRWVGPWARAHPWLAIAGAAAVARGIPTLALDRGLFFDVEAHWWIGALTLQGHDVYTDPLAQGRYPYPPLHMYISALMVLLSGQNRAAFLFLDKGIPALCGVGIALAIWATALRLGLPRERALVLGLLYAVNPLPVMVTAYHGQFEEIPLLFIILAFLLLCGRRGGLAGTISAVLSALMLGVAVAYKTWPLLFLPPLLLVARGWWRRLLYVPLVATPLAISVILYEQAFQPGVLGVALRHLIGDGGTPMQRVRAFVDAGEVLQRVAGYKGSFGFCWGYVSALRECWVQNRRLQPNPWVIPLNGKLLLVALLLVLVLLLWRRRPLEGMVALPLAFYLFSPGWGPNYSIWVLPFALLLNARLAMTYTLVMLPVVSLTYLDSLYAAYSHNVFSWAVLKPAEAALGLLGWCGIVALLAWLYLAGFRLATVTGRRRIGVRDEGVAVREEGVTVREEAAPVSRISNP